MIVTAEHTMKHDEEITIGLPDGGSVPATLVGRDPETDLAVLKANLTNPVVDFSDAQVQSGNLALAVWGAPDSGVNATMGVISAVSGAWRTWRGGMVGSSGYIAPRALPGSSAIPPPGSPTK